MPDIDLKPKSNITISISNVTEVAEVLKRKRLDKHYYSIMSKFQPVDMASVRVGFIIGKIRKFRFSDLHTITINLKFIFFLDFRDL